jgi:MFS transporter
MNAGASAVSAPRAVASPRVFNPWFIALAVVVPTFMEVLDTTIANVALRYIAGGLSAAVTDSEWVITSYLAANAIILPISGWLAAHLGRRNYFLLSIAVFTINSLLCGMATSLGQLILFRVMQGLAGGGLQPSSQSILLDSFPPGEAGRRPDPFWRRRIVCSCDRPDPRRLHHRRVFLALDLLHQPAGGRTGILPLLAHGAGPGIPPQPADGIEEAASEF